MSFPPEVKSHHTAWINAEGHHPTAVRYALDGERMVFFGDRSLTDVASGTPVWVSVHEIADGPPLVSFGAILREVKPDAIEANAIAELLDHIALGRTSDEVAAGLEVNRHRRLVALVDEIG